MNSKFTLIVLVAAMAIVALGLVVIPIHNAAALTQRTGASISTSINGVHISARGVNIDTGQSRERAQ